MDGAHLRIPRITINADFDEDVSVGEVNTTSLGYGLHQAWIYATMFGTYELFGVSTVDNGTSFSTIYLISLVANLMMLLIIGVLDQRRVPLAENKYPVVVAGIAMSLGTLLVYLSDIGGALGIVVSVVSALLTGLGSAVLLLCWGIAFSRMTLTSNIMNTAIAFIVAVFVYAGASYMPAPFSGLIAVALPIIEVFLAIPHTPSSYRNRHGVPYFNPLPVKGCRFFLMFGAPMVFYGIALGYIRETSMADILSTFSPDGQVVPLIVAELVSALVLVMGLGLIRSERVEDFLRPTVPFIALAMAFIPLEMAIDGIVSKVVVLSGYICFESVLWVLFGSFSQRYRLAPIMVFGIGRGALGVGAFIGLVGTSAFSPSGFAGPYFQATVIVVMLVCLIAGQSLLPRQRDIRRVIKHPQSEGEAAQVEPNGGSVEGASGDMVSLTIPALPNDGGVDASETAQNASSAQPSTHAQGHGAVREAAQDSTTRDQAHREDVAESHDGTPEPALAEIENTATNARKADDGQHDMQEPQEPEIPAPDSTGIEAEGAAAETADPKVGGAAAIATSADEEGDGKVAARAQHDLLSTGQRAAQETSSSSARLSDAPAETSFASNKYRNSRLMPAVIMAAEENGEESRKGYFRRKCEVIANQYLLSARETEVLFYLAKGYNSAYLQEKLYISEGTAKTHIRHIYGKTNVHSQQELMRLVNEVWV